jgi:vitamin K-dependent gamma-carboxylase
VGGPLLLFEKTKKIPLLFGCLFHLSNSMLFTIGVFPALMLSTMVLYIDPNTLRGILGYSRNLRTVSSPKDSTLSVKFYITLIFILLNVLIPLRPFIFTSRPNWSSQVYFNWRMMLNQEVLCALCNTK